MQATVCLQLVSACAEQTDENSCAHVTHENTLKTNKMLFVKWSHIQLQPVFSFSSRFPVFSTLTTLTTLNYLPIPFTWPAPPPHSPAPHQLLSPSVYIPVQSHNPSLDCLVCRPIALQHFVILSRILPICVLTFLFGLSFLLDLFATPIDHLVWPLLVH